MEPELPQPDLHEHRLPNQSFWGWIKTQTALLMSQVIVALSITLWMYSFVHYVVGYEAKEVNNHFWQYTRNSISILNILACFTFLIITIYIMNKNKYGKHQVELFYRQFFKSQNDLMQIEARIDDAEEKLLAFKQVYMWLWVAGIAYNFFSHLFSSFIVTSKLVESILDLFFNNIGLSILYACYRLLSKNERIIPTTNRIIYVIVLNLFVALLFYIFWLRNENVSLIWESITLALSGIVYMIVVALLVSTLDNKIIGLPSYLICILFIYAAIQPLEFVFIKKQDAGDAFISVTILFFAFILKVYFFSIISYATQTGRLLNFLTSKTILEEKYNLALQHYEKKKTEHNGV